MTDHYQIHPVKEELHERDIKLIESLAQLGSAQFASDLTRFLESARRVSRAMGVRDLAINASFDFSTWSASPLETLTVHLCQCHNCNKDRVGVSWKEDALNASQVRRLIRGLAVGGSDDSQDDDEKEVSGPLVGCRADNLKTLDEVTHAVSSAPSIHSFTGEIRDLMKRAQVNYLGFYLMVGVDSAPRDVTEIQFHWCSNDDCEEDAAIGRRRPTTLGQNGLPRTQRVCGWNGEVPEHRPAPPPGSPYGSWGPQ